MPQNDRAPRGSPRPLQQKVPASARRWFAGILISLQALVTACSFHRPVTVPVGVTSYPEEGKQPARCLVVLLPGRRSRGEEDFQRNRFIALARERRIDADFTAVDLHEGYYRQGVAVKRLWEDVVAPARASGYSRIWLVGISLGGAGAAGLAREHAGSLQGVVLLSPYLGPPELARQIASEGGLAAWSPEGPAGSRPFEEELREMWKWLRLAAAAPGGLPEVYLGYGLGDRFVPSLDLLAAALPAERVLRIPGGHDWQTWRALWVDFLDRGVLPRSGEAKREGP